MHIRFLNNIFKETYQTGNFSKVIQLLLNNNYHLLSFTAPYLDRYLEQLLENKQLNKALI